MLSFEQDSIDMEQSTIYDQLAIGCIVFVSLFLLIYMFLILYYKNKYMPIRAKNIKNTIFMLLFSLVHVWATFISNDHFFWTHNIRILNCELWSFWFQYALGCGPWFLFIIYRTLTCCFIYSNSLRKIKKKSWIYYILFILIEGSIISICLLVTLFKGSHYDEEMTECKTYLAWKISIMGWIVLCLSVFIFFLILSKKSIGNKYFNEYSQMRDIAVVTITIIAFNAYLNFAGILSSSIGRTVFTSLISLMHLFVASRILLNRLLMALLNSKKYLEAFVKSYGIYDVQIEDVQEILTNEKVMMDFLEFCSTHYLVGSMAHCINDITSWEQNPGFLEYSSLIDSYFVDQSDVCYGFKQYIKTFFVGDHGITENKEEQLLIFGEVKIRMLNTMKTSCGQLYVKSRRYETACFDDMYAVESDRLDKMRLMEQADLIIPDAIQEKQANLSFSNGIQETEMGDFTPH